MTTLSVVLDVTSAAPSEAIHGLGVLAISFMVSCQSMSWPNGRKATRLRSGF
jgi:hypothetical protein